MSIFARSTSLICLLSLLAQVTLADSQTSRSRTLLVELQNRSDIEQLGAILLAPLYVSHSYLVDRKPNEDQETKSARDLLNTADLVGWALFSGMSAAYARGFFVVPYGTFAQKSEESMLGPANKILIITSFKKEDPMRDFFQRSMVTVYRSSKLDVTVVSVDTADELRKAVERLPKNSLFDRVEINMHGRAGTLGLAGGTSLNAQNISEVLPEKEGLTRAGASVRLNSCSVAGQGMNVGVSDEGGRFMKELAKRLLPAGGTIIASPKMILSMTAKEAAINFALISPAGVHLPVVAKMTLEGFPSNPFKTIRDVRVFKYEIPTTCTKAFSNLSISN